MGLRIFRAPPHWLGIGASALALAVSGLFGGLNEVEADGPPTVALGELNTGTPWNVTVVSVEYTQDASPLKLQKPGDRWLLVRATVEVTSDESRFDVRDVLRLRDVGELIGERDALGNVPDLVYLRADIAHVGRLHPNVPEDLLFFWEQSGGAEPPAEVEIAVVGKTERVDSLSGHLAWLDPEPRALVRAVPEPAGG